MMAETAVHAADFTPGSHKAAVLAARLHPKLLELGYADPSQPVVLDQLCEFITILIGNAKTKEQINFELSDLIGNAYNPSFTDWLFDEVERISNDPAQFAPTLIPTTSITLPDEEPSQLTQPSRRDLRTPSSSARANAAPYPQPTRIVHQINRSLERPPPQDIKHTIPDLPNVPTGPRASAAGPIRRRNINGPHHRLHQPVSVLSPDFAAFIGANGLPPDFLQQMMLDAANFEQMAQQGLFQGPPPPPGNVTLAERISSPGMNGAVTAGRRRCRHWPRCNLGARCTFLHPSEICPDFPNCPNTDGTCLKIHIGQDMPESEVQAIVAQQLTTGRPGSSKAAPPPVKANGHHPPKRENQNPNSQTGNDGEPVPLCKFAAGCTKPDCPFAHPSPAAGPEGLVLRGEMCPDGRDCQNKECELGHPSPAIEGTRRKETEMCKFFPNCHNPECPFKHPAVPIQKALTIPCKFGQHCTRPNCIYSHEIAVQCRYNPCLNVNCPFQHEEGQQPNKNRVWTASVVERKFAVGEDGVERVIVGGGIEEQDETVVHE